MTRVQSILMIAHGQIPKVFLTVDGIIHDGTLGRWSNRDACPWTSFGVKSGSLFLLM